MCWAAASACCQLYIYLDHRAMTILSKKEAGNVFHFYKYRQHCSFSYETIITAIINLHPALNSGVALSQQSAYIDGRGRRCAMG